MYEQRQVYFRFGPRISPMIKKIIIITSAVFILQLILGLASGKRISFLEQVFALVPFSAVLRFELWRFVTYAFLHGGPFHVLFNMLGLYFFGPDIERNLGSGKHFLIFYCAAALTGGICQTGLAFAVGKQVPAIPIIGASAAVMAVIVAAAIYTQIGRASCRERVCHRV